MESERRATDAPGTGWWTPAPRHVAYAHTRRSLTRLLERRQNAGGTPVPACPGWNVTDLVRHLVGICLAVRTRIVRGEDAEVPALATATGPDSGDLRRLLELWAQLGAELDARVGGGTAELSEPLIMDAFTHELDIRRALDEPPPVGHPAFAGSLDLVARGFCHAVRTAELPPLRVVSVGGPSWPSGPGEPVATLRAAPWDLLRSLTGRRSPAQLAALDWRGADPAHWLPAFTWGPFTPPATAHERPALAR
ncbi:maleylpyruvate isomerase family mycothiol-dependent enzyme [Streptomyces sedi]|nr:maleylpyruvate isomerase family mycothiol-dependent enzyme [Streptomyces sedi]